MWAGVRSVLSSIAPHGGHRPLHRGAGDFSAKQGLIRLIPLCGADAPLEIMSTINCGLFTTRGLQSSSRYISDRSMEKSVHVIGKFLVFSSVKFWKFQNPFVALFIWSVFVCSLMRRKCFIIHFSSMSLEFRVEAKDGCGYFLIALEAPWLQM